MFLVAWQDCQVGWGIQIVKDFDWVGRFLKVSSFLGQVSRTSQRDR